MSFDRLIRKLVLIVAVSIVPTLAFAQPGPTSLVSVHNSGSHTFTFARVEGATWYYLWVDAEGSLLLQKWFTAAELGCAGTEVNCSIAVALPRAAFGTHSWWIQTWGPTLYGPWSTAGSWTSRPLVAPMVTDANGRYVGTLMSDNLVLLDVEGVPARAVIPPVEGFGTDPAQPLFFLFFLQPDCGGSAYGFPRIPDRIDFFAANRVSQGYLTRGTPITVTVRAMRAMAWDGSLTACAPGTTIRTVMPVTQMNLTSQFGSLTMPFKVVR